MQDILRSQKMLFDKFKNKLPSQTLIAHELSTALNISKSEAYSKLKGTSSITLQQVEVLCNKYDISFEVNPQQDIHTCSVKFTPFHTNKTNFSQYIETLHLQMQKVAKKGLINLRCSTDDIPFFHLFKYKELAAFKLHFWGSRIHSQQKQICDKIFNYKSANKKDLNIAYELYKLYLQTPCTEIWTKSDLVIIVEQIKYSIDSKLIADKKLQEVICEQLLQVLADIEAYAIDGCKNKNAHATFDWYCCDVVGNVSYLAEREDRNFCFLRFNTFNNFESSDESICNEVRMWLNSLLNEAIGFSGKGSKYRNIYLGNLRHNIELLSDNT